MPGCGELQTPKAGFHLGFFVWGGEALLILCKVFGIPYEMASLKQELYCLS